MGNRKLPFGYRIDFGQVVPHPLEAPLVVQIYEKYATGTSYKELVAALAEQDVLYDAGRTWNKNMVARILEDTRYLGQRGFPALVTPERFQAAVAKRTAKTPSSQPSEVQKTLRRLCGGKVSQRTEEQILHLLNQLIGTPESVAQPPPAPVDCSRIREIGQALEYAMDQMPIEEEQAKRLALGLAAAQFETLGSQDYETVRLRHVFSVAKPRSDLDADLLKTAVAAIQIQSGSITLRLKNGQIIGKKDEL